MVKGDRDERATHVSSMKNTMSSTTRAPYMEPMPYAQRHDVRATRKPNANGDRKGEMMKPMVQTLS